MGRAIANGILLLRRKLREIFWYETIFLCFFHWCVSCILTKSFSHLNFPSLRNLVCVQTSFFIWTFNSRQKFYCVIFSQASEPVLCWESQESDKSHNLDMGSGGKTKIIYFQLCIVCLHSEFSGIFLNKQFAATKPSRMNYTWSISAWCQRNRLLL